MLLIVLFLLISLFLGIILTLNMYDRKISSSFLYMMFLLFILACFLEIKGTPKNLKYEWRSLKENTIISTYEDEPKAIYVWLIIDGSKEPKAYRLPWSIETAENLRKAKERAKANNTDIEMNTTKYEENGNTEMFSVLFRDKAPKELPPKVLK
jgi:hypothetical protein